MGPFFVSVALIAVTRASAEEIHPGIRHHDVVTWDGMAPYPSNNPYQYCRWTKIYGAGGFAEMCVHSQKDTVSDTIVKMGSWPDCHILSRLWKAHGLEGTTYVEIGGNIGACVMHMLLSTNATDIRVFEPNPANLFCMTSTLLKLPSALRMRVTVYPFALGQYPEETKIYAAKHNMGNSVVGKFIKGNPGEEVLSAVPIQVKRYSDIIGFETQVSLIKMDAQGYECSILRGFANREVKVIKTEIANHWLSSQNECSDMLLFRLLHQRGMLIFSEKKQFLENPIKERVYDIVALKLVLRHCGTKS